ncbi:MAG: hypothetical protein ABI425_01790 [Patescibacteria group bacterium]
MKENPFLKGSVAKDQDGVEVNAELEAVVKRIASLLPHDVLFELFSSSPNETGGRSEFPYCRVDSQLIVSRNWVYIFEQYGAKDQEDFKRIYEAAATSAFKAIVWVEVGFQNLDNLAVSPASRNWTSGVGHFVNDQQRAEGIRTAGRGMYKQMLNRFVQFRDANQVDSDIFNRYNVEGLLDKFRSG